MAQPALLLTVILAGCLDGPTRLAREGNEAARAGRLDEAKVAFARLVEARPDDARAHLLLAHTHAGLRQGPEARAAYEAALALGTPPAAVALGLAGLELSGGSPDAALALLAPLPPTPDHQVLRARALLARGQAGDGARALTELGALRSTEAEYLRGSALMLERRFSDAQAAFAALEVTSPWWARYGLARLAAAQHRPADVAVHLTGARNAAGPQWVPAAVAADPAFDFVRDTASLQPLFSQ